MRDMKPRQRLLTRTFTSIAKRRWRFYGVIVSTLFIVTLLVLAAAYTYGPVFLAIYVDSEQGRQAASRALGNAVKVDGQFSPLHYSRWNIDTDSFQSVGWPGEALAGLNCQKIHVELDPAAVLHHAWRIKSVSMERAQIQLRPPDDALKRPPIPKKTRPWYLFFLPDHVECGPIVSEHSEVTYTYGNQLATIHDAHVQADLIGKDFKYTATSGVLNAPFLPPLQINRLEMLVTHPFIRIYSAELSGLPIGDPAHVSLSGTIGMRQNKAIDATVHVTQIPLDQVLPESLRPLLQGRATGDLLWKCDINGKMIDSKGDLKIDGLRVQHLSLFKPLSALGGNADLDDLPFDHATCHFHLQGDVIKMEISASVPNKFEITGTIGFHNDTRITELNLTVSHLALHTWLPPEMKAHSSGEAQAVILWSGRMDSVKDSTGSLLLNLDGTQIGTPPILKLVLRKKQIKAPEVIALQTGRFDFIYSSGEFRLDHCDLDFPGILSLKMDGKVSPDKTLNANLSWTGLRVEDWLPASLADQLTGEMQGEAHVEVHDWHLQTGVYSGNLRLLDGTMSYTSIQTSLGRFLSDRRLLVLPLNRAQFEWSWNDKDIEISNLDLQAGNQLGLEGNLHVSQTKRLSGQIGLGIQPVYLKSFYGLGDRLFSRNNMGLRWCVVHVSGTLDQPEEDFSKHLDTEMLKHPFSAIQFGGKMASWLLGGWFGSDGDWKRPNVDPHTPYTHEDN